MTWNVLHRVHAENYREPTVTQWPDESARVKAIAALVLKAVTADGCAVVLLQEVSGDVLTELRHRLPPTMRVCSQQAPRMPKFKATTSTALFDASEHVVIIGPSTLEVLRSQSAVDDEGKGLIAARVSDDVVAISTHVSWGSKGQAQLTVLRQLMNEWPGVVVLGGDFNAERATVLEGLGDDVTVAQLPDGTSRTRESPSGRGSDIDHLICRGATWVDVQVADGHHGLSDHFPLLATLR